MDLKKIMALAMLALMVLPSMTIVVRADEPNPEDGAGLADSIERARLYLDNVRTSAENLALEYPDNEMIQEYLNEINYLIDQDGEDGHANYYLDQASAYLEGGEFNLAARSLASARNILGRVKGILNSMIKIHKVARTETFIRQFGHRLEGLKDKMDRLRVRFGEVKSNKFKASMGLAKGKLRKLENVSGSNVDSIIDGIVNTTVIIDEGFDDLDGEGNSTILEAIYRLEAKIQVLNSTANRLRQNDIDVTEIDEDLENAEAMLEEIMNLYEDGKTEEAEIRLEEAEDLLSGVKSNIRGIRKENQNKDSKDKGK